MSKARRAGRLIQNETIALIGTGISTAVALIVWLSNLASPAESFVIGVLLAVVALLVQLLHDIREQAEVESSRRASGLERQRLLKLLNGLARVRESYGVPNVELELSRTFEMLEMKLDDMSRGKLVKAGDDFSDLLRNTSAAERELFGMTNITHRAGPPEGTWWSTGVGKTYWELNKEAVSRGVRVVRIFVYTEMTPDLTELLGNQLKAGVEVRTMRAAQLGPNKQLNFTIWDTVTAWEAETNTRGEIISNVVHLREEDVDRLVTLFETSLSHSDLWKPPSKQVAKRTPRPPSFSSGSGSPD